MHVNKLILVINILFLYCVFSATAYAGDDGSGSTNSIRVRELSSIHFGYFAVNQGTGAVVVDAHSGACLPQGVTMINTMCDRARFEVYGEPNARVIVQLVPDRSNYGQLDTLKLDPSDGMVTLDNQGLAYFYVGGTFRIERQLQKAQVSATYYVDVNYLP